MKCSEATKEGRASNPCFCPLCLNSLLYACRNIRDIALPMKQHAKRLGRLTNCRRVLDVPIRKVVMLLSHDATKTHRLPYTENESFCLRSNKNTNNQKDLCFLAAMPDWHRLSLKNFPIHGLERFESLSYIICADRSSFCPWKASPQPKIRA